MKPQWQQPFQQNVQRRRDQLRQDQMGGDWTRRQEAKAAPTVHTTNVKPRTGYVRGASDVKRVDIYYGEKMPFKAQPKNTTSPVQWASGCATFLIGVVITTVAGFAAGNIAYEALSDHDEAAAWIFAGAVWLIGLLISTTKARKGWR